MLALPSEDERLGNQHPGDAQQGDRSQQLRPKQLRFGLSDKNGFFGLR